MHAVCSRVFVCVLVRALRVSEALSNGSEQEGTVFTLVSYPLKEYNETKSSLSEITPSASKIMTGYIE